MTGVAAQPPASLLWALPDDAAAIAAIHAKLFATPWDADAVRALIEHPASVSLVAARTGRDIVGFVIAQIAADEAEVLSVGVAPDDQRQGIGRHLIEGAIRAAARSDARYMFLDVAENNHAARTLYTACGFSEAGRRKDYYTLADGKRDDALLLKRAIGA
jgi:ribosomal-protein-alanine N-acetyltransferase